MTQKVVYDPLAMMTVDEKQKLPVSRVGFRSCVQAARTHARQHALLKRIMSEGRGPSAVSWKKTEERLLEFVREPRVLRSEGLSLIHAVAWVELAERRSGRFAVLLRRWMRADSDVLASAAAETLASMGFEEDSARVVRALQRGSWRMKARVAAGAGLAASRGWSSARTRAAQFRDMAAWIRGERRVPRSEAAKDALSKMIGAMLDISDQDTMRLLKDVIVIRGNRYVSRLALKAASARLESYRPRELVDPLLRWYVADAFGSATSSRGRRIDGAGSQLMGRQRAQRLA